MVTNRRMVPTNIVEMVERNWKLSSRERKIEQGEELSVDRTDHPSVPTNRRLYKIKLAQTHS